MNGRASCVQNVVDWLADTTGDIAAQLRDAGRKDVRVFPSFGTYFYSFNCQPTLPGGRKNPFADVRVRQALTMAIDKNPIVQNVTKTRLTLRHQRLQGLQGLPRNLAGGEMTGERRGNLSKARFREATDLRFTRSVSRATREARRAPD